MSGTVKSTQPWFGKQRKAFFWVKLWSVPLKKQLLTAGAIIWSKIFDGLSSLNEVVMNISFVLTVGGLTRLLSAAVNRLTKAFRYPFSLTAFLMLWNCVPFQDYMHSWSHMMDNPPISDYCLRNQAHIRLWNKLLSMVLSPFFPTSYQEKPSLSNVTVDGAAEWASLNCFSYFGFRFLNRKWWIHRPRNVYVIHNVKLYPLKGLGRARLVICDRNSPREELISNSSILSLVRTPYEGLHSQC